LEETSCRFDILKLIICHQVDLVEPVAHFLEAARENLSPSNVMQEEEMHKATNFYCVPLQVLDSSLNLIVFVFE
jgi:AdoMet dependent proline di-methyltransferase